MLKSSKLIENYIVQIDKPFCIREISEVTGVPNTTVFNHIQQFKKQGRIVLINGIQSPKFYRYVRNSKATKTNPVLSFQPDMVKLKKIYDLIGKYPRVADLCKVLPYSETTIWRYVKVLMYDRCIIRYKGIYFQLGFKPSGKTFDQYPVIIKKYKRPELLNELKQICFRINKKMPDVSSFTNHDIIDLIESYYVKATIQILK
jgi:biotin operon repressor